MKNRIIASLLVVVMLVLALASCGSYDIASDDLGKYAEFAEGQSAEKFLAALKDGSIEITDGDFTTNEDTRTQKVIDDIYSSIISSLTTKLNYDESLKLTAGKLGANDILNLAYYVTDKDGNIVEYKYMGATTNTSSVDATSAKIGTLISSLKLPLIDEDSKDAEQKAKEALLAAIGDGVAIDEFIYKINSEAGAVAEAGKTVVVKYTCKYVSKEQKKDSNGNPVVDDNGNPVYITYEPTASYQKITLNKENDYDAVTKVLIDKLLASDIEATVGTINKLTKEGEGESETTKRTAITSFSETVDGIKYDFSGVEILWIVEDEGKELASITVKQEKATETGFTVEVADQHNKGDKISIKKDAELTYHIFPVSYVDVPEITAESIIKNVFGTSIRLTSLEVFESEEYKNGDKTLKALVEELVKLQQNDSETITAIKITADDLKKFDKSVQDAFADKTEITLNDLKSHYDTKSKVVSNAGSTATEAQKNESKAAQKAFNDVKDAEISKLVEKILGTTAEGKDAIAEVIVKEEKKAVYHKLKEAYDTEVTEAVGEAIWALIDKAVVIKKDQYPEELLEEFREHIYEEYEYEYYTGKDSKGTYYSQYDELDTFLSEVKAKDYDKDINKAIDAAAKKYLNPIIKVFFIANVMKDTAAEKFLADVRLDIEQGAYDAHYEDDDTLTEKENKKAREKAEKTAKENQENALENAQYFIINNDYMKFYKKQVGNAAYNRLIKDYGDINLRASFQFNRLFSYFTSANLEMGEDGDHVETKYTEGEGVMLDFRNVKYSIKADK